MKVKVTFECEVCPGVEPFIEKLIRYNFAHVSNYKLEEVEGFSRDENACT